MRILTPLEPMTAPARRSGGALSGFGLATFGPGILTTAANRPRPVPFAAEPASSNPTYRLQRLQPTARRRPLKLDPGWAPSRASSACFPTVLERGRRDASRLRLSDRFCHCRAESSADAADRPGRQVHRRRLADPFRRFMESNPSRARARDLSTLFRLRLPNAAGWAGIAPAADPLARPPRRAAGRFRVLGRMLARLALRRQSNESGVGADSC